MIRFHVSVSSITCIVIVYRASLSFREQTEQKAESVAIATIPLSKSAQEVREKAGADEKQSTKREVGM